MDPSGVFGGIVESVPDLAAQIVLVWIILKHVNATHERTVSAIHELIKKLPCNPPA